MVTPSHSSLLSSLSDALNHCPDPLAVQAGSGWKTDCITPATVPHKFLTADRPWLDRLHSCRDGGAQMQDRGGDPDTSYITLQWQRTDEGGLSQPPWTPLPPPSLLQPTPHWKGDRSWAQSTCILSILSPWISTSHLLTRWQSQVPVHSLTMSSLQKTKSLLQIFSESTWHDLFQDVQGHLEYGNAAQGPRK